MSVQIQLSRGDVYLGNQKDLKNGQIFLSYINKNPLTSNKHSYSEGQLWIKDPSNTQLTELANARSINSLSFKGYINENFDGDFVNAKETTQINFRHCHIGDFWIFDYTDTVHYNTTFFKGDILLITNTEYEFSENTSFRENLKSVEYIKIPGSTIDSSITDFNTEELNEVIQQLELRLTYKGEFKTPQEYYNLPKKKGYMYIATNTIYINKANLLVGEKRDSADDLLKLKPGDFIWWNGGKWVLIPSGVDAEEILYTPNSSKINAITTFADYHKEQLESVTNIQEAIDLLNISKAHLDKNGKIPYSELPDAVRQGLAIQGKFYPLKYKLEDKKNDPENQNPWPSLISEDEDTENLHSGCFWIVDCFGLKNIQYVDKTQNNRVIELNSGDWIVWVDKTNQFEIIDNSDRISSIDVTHPNINGKTTSLTGNIGLTTQGKVQVYLNDNNIILGDDNLVSQSYIEDGKENYFPIYTKNKNELISSQLHQENETIISNIGFQVGAVNNKRNNTTFGNLGVEKTAGSSKTSYINNYLFINSASVLKDTNEVFYRSTNIHASNRNTFARDDETLDIYLPEASSTLVATHIEDILTPNYITKTQENGFVTNSYNSEILYTNEVFDENFEQGFENIGIGRSTVEDTDTGEITFFAKTKDKLNNNFVADGFYTQYHSLVNNTLQGEDKVEHFLNRNARARTHLVINPTVLEDEIETFIKMPMVSGTLITWEEIALAFGAKGIPLMIPAWEQMSFRNGTFVGLDTSPITIKLNRESHDNVSIKRENDLATNYGTGDKSTWSYIDSNKEGSLQESRGSKDDIVSFDSWLESQRAIATKEAFIIPATAKKDGKSTLDMYMNYIPDSNETKNDVYGKNKSGGKYQRILPSRTLYPDESVYYDPITGQLIKQDVTTKDVEMPAVGGVLLTSRSRINGGDWTKNT